MKQAVYLILVSLSLAACGDDRQKAATAYCNCFQSKTTAFSPSFKRLMGQVAHSKTPQKTLREELALLDAETGGTVRQQMLVLQDVETEGIGDACEENIREFKIRGKDEDERIQQLHEAMKREPGCEVLSGLYALILDAKTKPAVH